MSDKIKAIGRLVNVENCKKLLQSNKIAKEY